MVIISDTLTNTLGNPVIKTIYRTWDLFTVLDKSCQFTFIIACEWGFAILLFAQTLFENIQHTMLLMWFSCQIFN